MPFCEVRCAYCDFNTYAGLQALMPAYVRALCREVEMIGESAPEKLAVHTVFFGGGTPSLLPVSAVKRILDTVDAAFELLPDCELTLEANPGTVDFEQLAGLHAAGINRISFGVQSANAHELKLLDRLHTFAQAQTAVHNARRAGFARLSLDVMFGLPYQTMAEWQHTLHAVLALNPDHLSVYALILEHGTPMQAAVTNGQLPLPDSDLAADMYEWASSLLAQHGWHQYEISNWARPQTAPELPMQQCRHNLQYWRNLPYLGFGAGAHGFAGGARYSNALAPQAFIKRMQAAQPRPFPASPACVQRTEVSAAVEMNDTLLMGMRLTDEGISAKTFEARFGTSLDAQFGGKLRALQDRGLVDWTPERARITPGGRLLANMVFTEFI